MIYKLIVQNAKLIVKTVSNFTLNINGIKDLFFGSGNVTDNKVDWTLQHYTDTASNLTANNPLLLIGQLGIETDDLLTAPKYKIGDGINLWNDLPYISSTNVNIQLGYKDITWFNDNPYIILLQGEIVFLEQTGTYKLGDGITELYKLDFLGTTPATPNLADVLLVGNSTGNTNILVETANAIELKNGSLLKEGTYDFGGTKGISQICSVGYEDNWQAGIRHVFDNSGFIRESSNCFNIIPDNTFDGTLRFKVGSRWVLDNGDVYVCSDAATGAAVWDLYSNQVNADWNATSGVAEILNKPSIPAAQIQSDWNQTSTSALDYIKNKPTISSGISNATASGTDTYTATVTGVTSYADGDAYLIRFTNGNTTNCTLNINSLGAIALYRNNDGALIGGDIQDNGEMLCVYNSANNNFQAIGTSPNSLISYVTNDDSVTLTKGMAVYAFSGIGDRLTVKRAYNTLDSTSAQTIGLVMSTSIGANQKGFIMMQGLLDGLSILPTSTWTDGSPVYLGATAGTITNVKPYAPNHLVYLGFVTTASNGSAGRLYIRVQNGYELDELHNVQAQSPTLKDTLYYDNTVSPAQWKTASISTILGYTPVTNARTLTINGTTYDLTADRTWTISAGSSLAIKDEGTTLTSAATSIDFTGVGVTASVVGTAVTVNVSGIGTSTNLFNYYNFI